MAYTKYSLTPANNTAAPPDGAPEGMLPSAVNDTMRDMMAQIRDCGDGIRDGTYTMTAPKITGGTITGSTINNSAIGATTASTGKFTAVTNSALTSGRVTYAGAAGVLQDDADFTFNGTTVTMANDASISGLTVGKGGGAISTNTAFGVSAGVSNTTGADNTFVGQLAGQNNTDGIRNSALGSQALQNNLSGQNTVAIGYLAAQNTTANGNTAVGSEALLTNTTGTVNIAIGRSALKANTTGAQNSATGGLALTANTTGSFNVANGYQALQANTTASNNTAVGYTALYSNTTGATNTAIGYQSLYANTTGTLNVATGDGALSSNTTGGSNTAFGSGCLSSNTTASNNTAIGRLALNANTTGINNCAVGRFALRNCTTGTENTALGTDAGDAITTGTDNTLVGYGAGYLMTTGSKNTVLGAYSGNQGGLDIRTASNYIVLSDGDGNPRFFFNGAVGYLNTVTRRNSGMLSIDYAGNSAGGIGINDTDSANASAYIAFLSGGTFRGSITNNNNSAVAYNTTSDYRLKENIAPMTGALDKVAQLKPCTYTWKETGEQSQGFIAHELAEVCPDAVTGEKDAVDSEGNPKYQGVDTSFLVATLTAAIQELNSKVEALEAQLNK